MAALQERNGRYRVLFRHAGKQHAFTVGKVSEEEAQAKASQVDYLLLRLKQKLAVIPSGIGIVEYLESDGKIIPSESPDVLKTSLTLLCQRYLETNEKSLEANTYECLKIHFRHFKRILGEQFCISDVTLVDLQGYVDKRAKSKGRRGKNLSTITIQKEMASLSGAWIWGERIGLLKGTFPSDGLRYPKVTEKPSFMTRQEIERQIRTLKLPEDQAAELWDALYLTVPETKEFLEYIKKNATQPFVYPMLFTTGHTGARRSELIRAKITDVDFDAKIVTIHERKRVKGVITTRRVPMSVALIKVLRAWMKIHPGGASLFCQNSVVDRSKKRSLTTGHQDQGQRPTTSAERSAAVRKRSEQVPAELTPGEAHDHLKRTLADSKWTVVKGFHVLRHSFVSACASKNIDQRLIDEFVGHQSEQQRRRYRHLYPSVKQEAIQSVFG